MGRNRKSNKAPRDMTILETEPEYRPPEGGACDIVEYPIDIGDGHRLLVHQKIYRGMVVDFAIMQFYDSGGDSHEIARIDCCHGMVHRHVFDRTGEDLMGRQEIKRIHVGKDEWATVDAEFGPCLERLLKEFEENHRRWAR